MTDPLPRPLEPDDVDYAPAPWRRIPDTCPRCETRMFSDGEWDYCENVDVCGYSRLSVKPDAEEI